MSAEPADVRILRSPSGLETRFAPSLAMVCCGLELDGVQLLGLRDGLEPYAARGSTMGIPLLHPWANRLGGFAYDAAGRHVRLDPSSALLHLEEHGLPIHGVVPSALPFTVLDHVPDGEEPRLVAELRSESSPGLAAAFPFPHTLRMEARLTATALTFTTELTALDDRVPVAFGHHPYLQLPDTPREEWRIAAPALEHMQLDEQSLPTGGASPAEDVDGPLGARTFDDLFRGVEDGAAFSVQGGGLRMTIRMLEGYRFAQIYAPPGQQVVCFEPMTAPADALRSGLGLRTLERGETHRGRFVLEVERD